MNPFSQLAPNSEQIIPEGIILHLQGGVLKLTIDRSNDLNRLKPEIFLRIKSITQNMQQEYSYNVDEGLIAHRENRTPHFIEI